MLVIAHGNPADARTIIPPLKIHMNSTMKNTLLTLASVAALTGAANAQTAQTVNWSDLINQDGTSRGNFDIGDGTLIKAFVTGAGFHSFYAPSQNGNFKILPDGSASVKFRVVNGYVDVSGLFGNLDNNDGNINTPPAEWMVFSPGVTINPGTNTAVNGLKVTGTADGSGVNDDGHGSYSYSHVNSFQINLHNRNPNSSSTGQQFLGALTVTTVPEPSSALLLGLGSTALLLRRKK